MKIKKRVYECCGCGKVIVTETNHTGFIYPTCKGLCRQVINGNTAKETVLPTQTKHQYIRDYVK